jgi:hypothetical protein
VLQAIEIGYPRGLEQASPFPQAIEVSNADSEVALIWARTFTKAICEKIHRLSL